VSYSFPLFVLSYPKAEHIHGAAASLGLSPWHGCSCLARLPLPMLRRNCLTWPPLLYSLGVATQRTRLLLAAWLLDGLASLGLSSSMRVRGCGRISGRNKAMFSLWQNAKSFQDSPSHRIYRHMYRALNVGKKITNYIVCL
jgi:hypothetical protein